MAEPARGALVPSPAFERSAKPYPLLRYPWADAKAALQSMAADRPDIEAVQLTYANPETGADAQNILGYYALMLKPGQALKLPARSPAMVFHVIEGGAQVDVESERFDLVEADTCCVPGYTSVTLTNQFKEKPSYLFIADESPPHRKLGVYEQR